MKLTIRELCLTFLITCLMIVHVRSQCATQNSLLGCLSCDANFYRAYNKSDSLYTCISTQFCLQVQLQQCIACQQNYIISNQSECLSAPGCISLDQNDQCIECQENYDLDNNNNCILKDIVYCQQYTNGTCTKCLYQFMNSDDNCSINQSLCSTFNENVWKCITCPTNKVIDSSGSICVEQIQNCIQYQLQSGNCIFCEEGYYISDSQNITCESGLGIFNQIYEQNVNQYLYTTICLRKDKIIDTTTNQCSQTISDTDTHCLTTTSSTCSQCRPGYYSSSTTSASCLQCSAAIDNCIQCSSSTQCSFCQRGYYLLPSTLTIDQGSQCLSCEAYGCEQCASSSLDSSTQSLQVRCLSCNISAILYQGACFKCDTENSSYSVQTSKCHSCSSLQNCRYCILQNDVATTCKWCIDGYFVNSSGQCQILRGSTVPQLSTAYQILGKSSPGIQKNLQNDQALLMSSCQKTNGYICQCSQANTNSICGTFDPEITVTNLLGQYSQTFRKWSNQLRMASQFPSFTYSQINITGQILMSASDYWNLLSAYTNLLIKGSSQSILSSLSDHLTNAMDQVFSKQQITLLTGNGFYYKYVPAKIADSSKELVSTTISNSNWVLTFIWFDRNPASNVLTGHIYVFTDSSSEFNVSILKNGYLANSQNFTLQINGQDTQNSIILSEGYLYLNNFSNSRSSVKGYQVFAQSQNTIDQYETERIQYIFYSESFIYILFFLLLYLIFLPLCSMVDCCRDIDQVHRKKIRQSQEQNSRQPSESSNRVININYRQFFPIYNVANTKRPQRLKKLCLLIVNLQHGVTFLTLIYFNLNADLGVAAVALAIPGYLCTVLAGYICGFIFRTLPTKFKYLINLISLGYWILWVFLMRLFLSDEYKLFLVTFVIIFFIVDLIIDSLETLLVYFAIRQGQNQLSLFKCLAKWLSFRGYYEFDKLARDLQETEE